MSVRYQKYLPDEDFSCQEKHSEPTPLLQACIQNADFTKHAYSYRVTTHLERAMPDFSAKQSISIPSLPICITIIFVSFLVLTIWPMKTMAFIGLSYLLLGAAIMGFRGVIFLIGLFAKDTDCDAAALVNIDALPDRNTKNKVITVLIPLYQENNMVCQIASAIEALEYPHNHLDVKILLEDDDIETIKAVRSRMHASFYHLIIVPASFGPKTKPRACNLGLWAAKGDYIVIYDAEDQPESDQLKKAVAAFAKTDEEVACLQARLSYYNARQNILTRLFSLEYSLLFNFLLPGLAWLKMPLPLGGTSNFFKTDILKSVGGWDPYNVTEDADLGMRLGALGYRSEMLSSSTHEQATATFATWTTQRARWIKGFIQTWLVHHRHSTGLKGKNAVRYAASVYLVVGAVLWAVYLNPVFGLVYLLEMSGYMSFSIATFPDPIGTIALYFFAFSTGLQIMLMGLTPLKTGQWRLALVAPLAPLYWSLQAIAGGIALMQMFRRPYYWDKTTHYEREVPGQDRA